MRRKNGFTRYKNGFKRIKTKTSKIPKRSSTDILRHKIHKIREQQSQLAAEEAQMISELRSVCRHRTCLEYASSVHGHKDYDEPLAAPTATIRLPERICLSCGEREVGRYTYQVLEKYNNDPMGYNHIEEAAEFRKLTETPLLSVRIKGNSDEGIEKAAFDLPAIPRKFIEECRKRLELQSL
jgi:hypothetical protein